jgi:hypothetical protein
MEEIKEGLKYENNILFNDLKLEKNKRLEYEKSLVFLMENSVNWHFWTILSDFG